VSRRANDALAVYHESSAGDVPVEVLFASVDGAARDLKTITDLLRRERRNKPA
jgi:hypothetical protein